MAAVLLGQRVDGARLCIAPIVRAALIGDAKAVEARTPVSVADESATPAVTIVDQRQTARRAAARAFK